MTLELLLSVHDRKCLSCKRSGTCELQKLCNDMGIDSENRYEGAVPSPAKRITSTRTSKEIMQKCILLPPLRGSLPAAARRRHRREQTAVSIPRSAAHLRCRSAKWPCVSCGQHHRRPTGALTEKDDTEQVGRCHQRSKKVVGADRTVRPSATLGEEFGMPIGTNVEGKMVAALRRLGFDKVYDTDFGADMTIMEEANEFIDRVKNGGKLPIITSCSPGWVRSSSAKALLPEISRKTSTCKSSAADDRCAHQNVVCGKRRHRSEQHRFCFRHAVRREEIRDQP